MWSRGRDTVQSPWITYLGNTYVYRLRSPSKFLAGQMEALLPVYCCRTGDAQEKTDPWNYGAGVLTGQACDGCGYLIRKFTCLKSARNCLDAKAKIKPSPESFNLITHISEKQVEFSDGERQIEWTSSRGLHSDVQRGHGIREIHKHIHTSTYKYT